MCPLWNNYPSAYNAAKPQPSKSMEANMRRDEDEDTIIYKVVINAEEQYSIWPADRENAFGWQDVGKTGTRADCLEFIKHIWTDIRPLSLRQQMGAVACGN